LVSATLIVAGFSPGTPIQQVPKWTGSVSLAYHHELSSDLALIGRAESTYVGNRTDATFYTNDLPPNDITNVRGGLEGANWSAVIFVNNVADNRAILNNVTADAINLATYNRVAVSQPRTAGIDLNYKFK
jgi:iron complex outermembrane receptor protein